MALAQIERFWGEKLKVGREFGDKIHQINGIVSMVDKHDFFLHKRKKRDKEIRVRIFQSKERTKKKVNRTEHTKT